MPASLRNHATKLLDLLLPPLCAGCEMPVAENHTLCPACWSKMQFVAPPFCGCCGLPFEIDVEEGTLCGSCLTEPPPFHSARAATIYNDASRHIILSFKHGDRTHMAPTLASWMYRAGNDMLASADFIIPVPLHRWRLFRRRYNQSALLAQYLGEKSGKPVLQDGLLRLRSTPSQGHMTRKERTDNVKNAFSVSPVHAKQLQDKRIVLVDDVFTTGATLRECAKVLTKSGVSVIDILTFTRVRSAD